MKNLKIVTALTATALTFTFAATPVHAATATPIVTTLSNNLAAGEMTTDVFENETLYTNDVYIPANTFVQFSASAHPRVEEGEMYDSIDLSKEVNFVLKDENGKVVATGTPGDMENTQPSLFISGDQFAEGSYTLEYTSSTNIASDNDVIEFSYYAEQSFNDVSIVSIDASTDDFYVGTPSTLDATVTKEGLLTQVEVLTPGEKDFKVVQAFGDDTEYVFTPTKEGVYEVRYTVQDPETEEVSTLSAQYDVQAAKANAFVAASKLTAKFSKTTVKPKATVTVNASAKGTAVKYKIAIKENGKNKIVKNYTASKKLTFKAPTKKGKYVVTVYAKSSKGGKVVKTTKTITVK